MPESPPRPELMRSLGDLVRGLSVLFWALPASLIICVQTAQADYLRIFGVFPAMLSTGSVVYGLVLLGRFHKEEIIWIRALERARILAVVSLGLSPFLFWWSRMPSSLFYTVMIHSMAVCGLGLLLALNPVLRRLTAMLPDEALRHETLLFTRMNAVLVAFDLALVAAQCAVFYLKLPVDRLGRWQVVLERASHWSLWFFVLLTVAVTMGLIWKTKEVIFQSVFGGKE
jgi:hypothetical protein